jgi:hypothetical protein
MVASVAVLSDIHAVLPALDAVLAEPAVQAAERIVLTPGRSSTRAVSACRTDVAEWTDYFLHARATDADALAAFAPRDGRLQPAGRTG